MQPSSVNRLMARPVNDMRALTETEIGLLKKLLASSTETEELLDQVEGARAADDSTATFVKLVLEGVGNSHSKDGPIPGRFPVRHSGELVGELLSWWSDLDSHPSGPNRHADDDRCPRHEDCAHRPLTHRAGEAARGGCSRSSSGAPTRTAMVALMRAAPHERDPSRQPRPKGASHGARQALRCLKWR